MSHNNIPISSHSVSGCLWGEDILGIRTRAGKRCSEDFLWGPIPIRLIRAVSALPRQPLPVLLAIYHRIDLTGDPWVTLPRRVMAEFRFDRQAKSHALAAMERAGLIQVKRSPGRPSLVSLVAHSASEEAELEDIDAECDECAECGVETQVSRWGQATFVCVACGHIDNAKDNAARIHQASALARKRN
jgi:hypothetical protein